MCTRDNIVHNLDINICVRRVKSLDLRSGIFFDTFSKSCYANFKYREIRNWINLGWSSKSLHPEERWKIQSDYLKILIRLTLNFLFRFSLRVQLPVNDIFTARLKFLTKVFQSVSPRSTKLVYSKFSYNAVLKTCKTRRKFYSSPYIFCNRRIVGWDVDSTEGITTWKISNHFFFQRWFRMKIWKPNFKIR